MTWATYMDTLTSNPLSLVCMALFVGWYFGRGSCRSRRRYSCARRLEKSVGAFFDSVYWCLHPLRFFSGCVLVLTMVIFYVSIFLFIGFLSELDVVLFSWIFTISIAIFGGFWLGEILKGIVEIYKEAME